LFRPYTSLATIQNEDNQTIYYKFCQGSKSIAEISYGLRQLKERNPKEVRVIYVDNCCSVRPCLQEIFGIECLVKLNAYHFMVRFDVVIYNTKSEEATIFRALLRHSMFITADDGKFCRAAAVVKEKLVKQG
jgi:hypothetical protein